MIRKIEVYECVCDLDAEHKWLSRSTEIPKRCPKCKSRKWNNGSTGGNSLAALPENRVVVEEESKRPAGVIRPRKNGSVRPKESGDIEPVVTQDHEEIDIPEGMIPRVIEHDVKNCRIYGCYLCKELKGKK